MCGITGFIDYNKRTKGDVIIRMTNSLHHRGPDDNGTFFDQKDNYNIGLGQTRLSILDLSPNGRQPMFFRKWIIIFNGEIYNFKEIGKQLIGAGYELISGSDTEVILKAFDYWGIEAVHKFIGMFAFVIYHKEKETIHIFRDRAGVKPLFYYYNNGLLLFGSELKSFHQHPNFEKRINQDNLALFLQYNYVPTPYSIFDNTHKLDPGSYIKIELKKQTFEIHKYWSIESVYNQPKLNISYSEAKEELEQLLINAFSYRMVSDVPVGMFLSGGYDSSAVAAILQANSKDRLKTFTIGYEENEFDESRYAKMVANHIGSEHYLKIIRPNDVGAVLQKLPFIYDEPFADNSVVPTILVSQFAREHVKVALSGDAGDEIFAGYNKYDRSISLTNLPNVVQSFLSGTMNLINPERIPVLKNTYNFSTRYNKMKNIWSNKTPDNALKIISQFVSNKDLKKYLLANTHEKSTYFDIASKLNQQNSPLNKLLAIDYKTFLLDNNLAKVDRATMAVGLEGREPFLDHRIIEFAARLPDNYKLRNGVHKSILKDIVHKYIPKKIMDRPKMPFLAPLSKWLGNDLKSYYIDYINEDKIKKDGFFSNDVVKLRDDFLKGKKVNNRKLWNILVFQMWKEKWD
jgi:asparagine synthase (glutamine-hydrolysing)